jgi:hypothetical protein
MLRHYLAKARAARRRRLRAKFPPVAPGERVAPDDWRRRRAALLLERSLAARCQGTIDASLFFETLATRLQMASGVIGAMMTSVPVLAMDAASARALATIIADLIYHAEESVPAGGMIRVYLAIAFDHDLLVVGVGIEGRVNRSRPPPQAPRCSAPGRSSG